MKEIIEKPKRTKKSEDEKIKLIEQKIHKLEAERKRLKNKKEYNYRKKRDHSLIVIGATILSKFSKEEQEKVINSNDDEIVKWVFSILEKADTNDN